MLYQPLRDRVVKGREGGRNQILWIVAGTTKGRF